MASWGIALRSFSEVGPVAQLVARFIDIEKVIGSSPIGPTIMENQINTGDQNAQ